MHPYIAEQLVNAHRAELLRQAGDRRTTRSLRGTHQVAGPHSHPGWHHFFRRLSLAAGR